MGGGGGWLITAALSSREGDGGRGNKKRGCKEGVY